MQGMQLQFTGLATSG